MSHWSIEQELCDLAQRHDLHDAVRHLGVFSDGDLAGTRLIQDWAPGGAETYIYVFEALSSLDEVRRLILKAFVPPPGAHSPGEALNATIDRASLLARDGVATPLCLGSYSGTALYAYIDHPLGPYLSNAPEESITHLITELVFLTIVVSYRGFRPIDLFSDLRTDGKAVYIVDLGTDLGPPGVRSLNEEPLRGEALRWVRRWVNISGDDFMQCVAQASALHRSGIL